MKIGDLKKVLNALSDPETPDEDGHMFFDSGDSLTGIESFEIDDEGDLILS